MQRCHRLSAAGSRRYDQTVTGLGREGWRQRRTNRQAPSGTVFFRRPTFRTWQSLDAPRLVVRIRCLPDRLAAA